MRMRIVIFAALFAALADAQYYPPGGGGGGGGVSISGTQTTNDLLAILSTNVLYDTGHPIGGWDTGSAVATALDCTNTSIGIENWTCSTGAGDFDGTAGYAIFFTSENVASVSGQTLNVDGQGLSPIADLSGNLVTAGQIPAGTPVVLIYDPNGNWDLQLPSLPTPITINGQSCALGGSCTVYYVPGTVPTVSISGTGCGSTATITGDVLGGYFNAPGTGTCTYGLTFSLSAPHVYACSGSFTNGTTATPLAQTSSGNTACAFAPVAIASEDTVFVQGTAH